MARYRDTVALLFLLLLVLTGSALADSATPLVSATPPLASDGVVRPASAVQRLVAPVEEGVSRLAGGLSARNAIRDAWRLAREAGPYGFSADVTQETVPLALPANAGRSSSAQRYYLEGAAEPASRRIELALWSQGGSVLRAEDRVEMRIDGDRVTARQGDGAWEEAPDVTGWLAPQGDLMAFLAATKNALSLGEETHNGVSIRRYAFDVDGPRFAEYVRGEMERALQAGGELPAGVRLELPQAYAGMTGDGELWLDASGLPLREILHVVLAPQGDYRLRADLSITFDFSDGGTLAALPGAAAGGQGAPAATGPAPAERRAATDWILSLGLGAATLALLLSLLAAWGTRSRRVEATLALLIILAMIATPLLQAERVVAFSEQQHAREQSRLKDVERERVVREARESLASSWDPHRDPLADGAARGLGETDGEGDAVSAPQTMEGPSLYRLRHAAPLADPNADSDGDGLTDAEERALGTSSATTDYDLDGRPDGWDTDGDGLSDAVEVAGFAMGGKTWYLDPLSADTNGDGLADLLEWGPGDTPLDTDGDGIPDLFDLDNDNDGVPDHLDLSPFSASARSVGGVGSEGRPASLEALSGRIFRGKNPNSPTNYDYGPYPLGLTIADIPIGAVTYLDLQLRPKDAQHLWYAYNVLDWPSGDDKGQIQDLDGATLFDACVSRAHARGDDPAEACSLNPDANGDIKLVPMLEMNLWVPMREALDLLPSLDVLSAYGISLQETGDQWNNAAVYIPVHLVTDPNSGERVAFQGRMLFEKSGSKTLSPDVNLVWSVQGLVDDVCVERDGEGKCTRRANNVQQVIATYPAEWYLTGLDLQVNHGVDYAIVREDPAVDPDPGDDAALLMLQSALDATFLAGRATDGARDTTVAELKRRFDHATNDTVSETERWGIPNVLSVTTGRASDPDRAMATIAMTDTVGVLSAAFGASPASPVTPTVMFAREEAFTSYNLDHGYGQAAWSPYGLGYGDSHRLDINLAGAKRQVMAGLSWATYAYDPATEGWRALSLSASLVELARRYAVAGEGENADYVAGQTFFLQQIYRALHDGVGAIVEQGGIPLEIGGASERDEEIAGGIDTIINAYGGAAPDYLVGDLFTLQDVIDVDAIMELVGKVGAGQADATQLAQAKAALEDASTIGRRVEKGIATVAMWAGIGLAITSGILGIVAQFASPEVAQDLALASSVLATLSEGIGLAMQIYTVVRTAMSVASTAGVSMASAVGSTLGTINKIASTTGAAAVIGAVISVGMAWGSFIYSACSGGASAGSVAFYSGLAAAIAATILAIVLFAISLSVIGSIIVAIASFIDLILGFFGITGFADWFTKALAGMFYQAEVLVDFQRDDLLVMEDVGMSLRTPEDGLKEGNQLLFEATLLNTVRHRDFEERYDGYSRMPDSMKDRALWTADALKATQLHYLLAANAALTNVDLAATIQHWRAAGYAGYLAAVGGSMKWFDQKTFTDVYPEVCYPSEYGPNCYPPVSVTKYQASSRRGPITSAYGYQSTDGTVLPGGVLAPGVNAMQPLFLYMAYEAPTSSCWLFSSCSTKAVTGTARINLSNDIVLDVVPDTLDGFYRLDWASTWRTRNLPAWLVNTMPKGLHFPAHRDYDGDGLLSASAPGGGSDPDDTRWDTDGDGLSDYFEVNWRAPDGSGAGLNPRTPDTDGDGLSDAEEIRLGTNPTVADTDGDGLSDYEEARGWAFEYAPGKITWVTSSPLLADTDGDGLTDAMEKRLNDADPTLRLNPRAWNECPVTIVTETTAPGDYTMPGASLAYTMTLRNDLLTDMYVQGVVTTTLPAVLGGRTITRTFNLARDQAVTQSLQLSVPAKVPSQSAAIHTEASTRLVPYAGGAAPDQGISRLLRDHTLVIDNDLPTASLSSPPFVTPGGTRIIWGAASDPTSPVALVDVRVDDGAWQRASGTTHWTYALDLPGEEGAHTLSVRATDTVGHAQSPLSSTTLYVEGTPPDLSIDVDGNPIVRALHDARTGRWRVALSGTVVDPASKVPASGIKSVAVRFDPNDDGWQLADVDTSTTPHTWAIDYILGRLDGDGEAGVYPTGQYTVSVRAIDNAVSDGNETTIAVPLRLDSTPPTVGPLEHDGASIASPVTASLGIGGGITDPGEVASGLAQMEIAFMPRDVVDGLADPSMYLMLDELPGETAFRDLASGVREAACRAACPTVGADGRFGLGVSCAGAAQGVLVSDVDLPLEGYSLILWLNTTCADCGLATVTRNYRGVVVRDRALYLADGNLYGVTGSSAQQEVIASTGHDYADGRWHMVVHTVGAGGHVLYVDGQRAALGVQRTGIAGADRRSTVTLGYAAGAGHPDYVGSLDEAMAYPLELTPEQVSGLYQAWSAFVPDEAGVEVVSSTWSRPVPLGLEGQYQIDLTGSDQMGNRNDARATWNHWRGEIDTAPPRVGLTVTYSGQGTSAKTTYEGWAEDANLRTVSRNWPGPTPAEATSTANGVTRKEITGTVDGLQRSGASLTACDTNGRCAVAKPSQYQLYWSDASGALLRSDLDLTHVITLQMPYTDTHGSGFVEQWSRSQFTDWAIPGPFALGLDAAHDSIYWSYQGMTGGRASTASSAPAMTSMRRRPSPRSSPPPPCGRRATPAISTTLGPIVLAARGALALPRQLGRHQSRTRHALLPPADGRPVHRGVSAGLRS